MVGPEADAVETGPELLAEDPPALDAVVAPAVGPAPPAAPELEPTPTGALSGLDALMPVS